jgi:K+-sensing histidine kinase KdpD
VPSHTGTEAGFGLGLSIVSRLLALLGHPLKLESRLDRGSVFRLVFEPGPDEAADPVPRAADGTAANAVAQSSPWVRA